MHVNIQPLIKQFLFHALAKFPDFFAVFKLVERSLMISNS